MTTTIDQPSQTLPNQLIHDYADLNEIADRPAPDPPRLPAFKTYRSWPLGQREALDEERYDYFHQLPYLRTQDCLQLEETARKLIRRNRRATGTSQGLVLTGPAFTGKSSALRSLAIRHNRHTRKVRPNPTPYAEHIPVIFVEVGAASTVKGVVRKLVSFTGSITPRGNTTSELMLPLRKELRACATELIILDEGHCLTGGQAVSDFIKELLNNTSATIILAGIDMANTNVFLGSRKAQTIARFTELATNRHHIGTNEALRTWQGLIAGFEDRLPLLAHPKRSLAEKHPEHLYTLTSGAVGSLAALLEAAFAESLGTNEKIGKKQLEAVAPSAYRIEP